MRREVHRVERIGAARFQIDSLPHAMRRAVALFTLELERMRCVVDTHHEPLRPIEPKMLRELERKWRVAALVHAERLSIDPSRRAPIRRTEDEEHASAEPRRRNANGALIPSNRGAVRHTGEWRAP